ncbi:MULTISPECIES: LacI family DNA-binding transcriptional regulator [unclassified Streptomyces]|uniref:LacI family DNA-binding transcriptional regulator n=1 Tax=unclassified Streptomyces TaxID=2593676 RepID=UPI000B887C79|nr:MULTISPECIES: LacI family DNA-binding transcriptional regulator [unclassified Streptomyces]MYR30066.1 substrate-binding domain-containing protein [Streptomyces sp. SID4945]
MSVSARNPAGGRPARPVTLAQVAQRAGVSTQTVSNALNSPELLAPRTLERVREAVAALDYRPHQAARSLRTRSSRLIGYGVQPAVGGLSTAVLDGFLHALSDSADRAGYRVLLFAAPVGAADEAERYDELLREHAVDGFVLSGTYRGDKRPQWLHKREVPFVAFGRSWSTRDVGDWVDVDGAHGTAAAVDQLVAAGHRRIAFLGWPRGSGSGDDRARGWREAMRRHELPVRDLRVASVDDVDAAREAVARVLPKVTAVVAASDTLALGCYHALRDAGRVPGRDVAVTGFDDSPAAALLSPALSSVRQPLEEVGRACTRLLLSRIKNPQSEPERLLLEPELVVRDSSAAVTGS